MPDVLLDSFDELIGLFDNGLCDKVRATAGEGPVSGGRRGVRGDDDDRNVSQGSPALELSQQGQPTHSWELEIEEHGGRTVILNSPERFFRGSGLLYLEGAAQQVAKKGAVVCMVVDH